MSRSLQIQEIFRTMKMGDLNITNFCHTLENLYDALNDVHTLVSETNLVMRILCQLPQHIIVDIITNTKPVSQN